MLLCEFDSPPWLSLKDLISLFALVLSAAAFIYSRRKDVKTRQQSIEDEFWLRRVLGPITIEPLIKIVLDTLEHLPADFASPGWRPEALEHYSKKYQVTHQRLVTSFRALALLDKTLCKETIDQLDKIEDTILDYCDANIGKRRAPSGSLLMPHAETQASIVDHLLGILNAVRRYQTSHV